ncbi:MAG: vWA domain-containing protein [Gammaproteobacteria bacterium]
MLGVTHPLGLLLLPLVFLPFLAHGQTTVAYSSLSLLPVDRLSYVISLLLRLLAATFIAAIVLGVSGLFRSEEAVERIGQGAQTVMLIDSSGSMDRPFASGKENIARVAKWGTYTSKGQVARRLLAEYASQRKQDMFALFVFSGNPIAVLPLTEKQAVVQAAIAAGSIERGLATTDLGAGLIQSLEFFKDKPFTGSRIVMLVSDGAARLTVSVQDQIKNLMEKHRVSLYWIYLRALHSPGLYVEMEADIAQRIAPEQLVHKFFSEMGLPYRAFSAENPEALQEAIAHVNKLQNLPIRYTDTIPKQDLSGWCYGIALSLLILLFQAKFIEIRQWH